MFYLKKNLIWCLEIRCLQVQTRLFWTSLQGLKVKNGQSAFNDWLQGKQWVLFPRDPQTLRSRGNKTPCFPWIIFPPNSKMESRLRNNYLLDAEWHNKVAAISRCTTWSRASRKFKLLFSQDTWHVFFQSENVFELEDITRISGFLCVWCWVSQDDTSKA